MRDLPPHLVSLLRYLLRLPPGDYQVRLTIPLHRRQPWEMQVTRLETVRRWSGDSADRQPLPPPNPPS